MAWIEAHQGLARHPKTKRLARLLNLSLPTVIGHLFLLWWWALDYAQDGDLSRFDDDDICDAVDYSENASRFVSALTAAGFLDEGSQIHDWDEYAGRLLEKRRVEAERKKIARRRVGGILGMSAGRPQDGARNTNSNTKNVRRASVDAPPVDNSDVNQSRAAEATERATTNGESLEVKTASGAAPTRTVDRSTTRADKDSFSSFWASYPKKVGKGAAETAWRKLKPDADLVAAIIAAVERAKTSRQWLRDGGQYIPNPATWLNQRRWEDEPDTKAKAGPTPAPPSPRHAGQSTAMYDTDAIVMARLAKYAAEHPDEDEDEEE